MNTFETIIVISTLLMIAFATYMTVRKMNNGEDPIETVMEQMALITITYGEKHMKTFVVNVVVFVFVLLFNHWFNLPVYTGLWLSLWASAWVVQFALRFMANVKFKNIDDYGFSVIASFAK